MRVILDYRGGPADGEEAVAIGTKVTFYHGRDRGPTLLSDALAGRIDDQMATYRLDRTERSDSEERRIYKFIGHKTAGQLFELTANLANEVEIGDDGNPRFRDDHN